MNWSKRMTKIISVIRNMSSWDSNHCQMDFPKGKVGYYDTKGKDDYFTLKFDGIEVNHNHLGLGLVLPSEEVEIFNLDKWLTKLEKVVICDYLVKDGKTYILTQVEEQEDKDNARI